LPPWNFNENWRMVYQYGTIVDSRRKRPEGYLIINFSL
jgi:hypothetical protein